MDTIKIDDILAALILSLAMMRRIEIKTADPEQNSHVEPAAFRAWRRLALRAYDQVSLASGLKVVFSLGWFAVAMKLGIGAPWLHLGGLSICMLWIIALAWAWKIATDARHLRIQLRIAMRRSASPTQR